MGDCCYRILSEMRQYDWDGNQVPPVEVSTRAISKTRQRFLGDAYDLTRAEAYMNLASSIQQPARQLSLDAWCKPQDSAKAALSKARSLNDLPKDVALLILETCFKQSGGIELCPLPFEPLSAHENPLEQVMHQVNVRTLETHRQRVKDHISPFLGLLRVSKAWNQMGSDILYSSNQFRFSNNSGWHTLEEFLRQIGNRNVERLRDIVVIHPEFVQLPRDLQATKNFFHGSPCIDRNRVIAGGWEDWVRDPTCQALDDAVDWGAGDYRAPRRSRYFDPKMWHVESFPWSAAIRLERAGTLRHLRFIVPYNEHSPKDVDLVHPVVLGQRFEHLEITIVRMHFMGDFWWSGIFLEEFPDVQRTERFPGLPACQLAARLNATTILGPTFLYADVTPDVQGRYRLEAHELPRENDSKQMVRWGVNFSLYKTIAREEGMDVSLWSELPRSGALWVRAK